MLVVNGRKLEDHLKPVHLRLINDSHKHAGHYAKDGSAACDAGETHFRLGEGGCEPRPGAWDGMGCVCARTGTSSCMRCCWGTRSMLGCCESHFSCRTRTAIAGYGLNSSRVVLASLILTGVPAAPQAPAQAGRLHAPPRPPPPPQIFPPHPFPSPARPCRLEVTSDGFAGLGQVKRHQLVYGLLGEEFAAGLHALSMTTKTTAEVAKK